MDFIGIVLVKVAQIDGKAVHIPAEFKVQQLLLSILERRNAMLVGIPDDSLGVILDGDIDVVDFLRRRLGIGVRRCLVGACHGTVGEDDF